MKKIWSLFLTVCMVSALFGSIPVTVNAETNGTDNSLIISKDSFSVLNDSVESGENSTTVISNNLQNDNVFAEGDGTAENPYQVATPEQLNEVRNYLSAYFIQICDIDMTEATSENGIYYNFGSGWVPIGDDTAPFTGTYNGDEHKIIGLKSNQIGTSQEYAGLFGNNKGVICNLGMVDNYIIGNRRYIGSIAGRNSGNIENCYNTGIISASPNGDCHTSYVGGIVGLNGGNVKKCYNAGTITSSVSPSSERAGMMPTVSAAAGGIVGSDNSGTIENCCNTGTVTSFGSYSYKPSDSSFRPYLSSYAGGIVGEGDSLSKSIKYCCNMGVVSAKSSASIPGDSSYADNSNSYAGGIAGLYAAAMENCYNTGEITAETDKGSSIYDHNGNSYAGGITGWSKYIAMKDCYNTGKVVASVIDAHSSDHAYAGGISGILPVGIIENSYNIGNVTTLSNAGHICASGIVADRGSSEGSGSVIDCYYYDDPNFKAIAGTPLSLEELKQQDSYVGFDFEMVWDISLNVNDGFPSLRNMPEPLCIHVWGAWSITKQPTQTETGTAERVCQNDSSHKDTMTLPVLTDTNVWAKGEYQAPTCEADGYQKYTSEYGEVTEIIPATDHNWGAWTITKQPTQTETGTAERVCQNNSSHKDQKELPVLTDTTVWIKGDYQAPTCEADGYQKYTSDYGEVTETIPATDHNWGAWNITKQPTQTETGTAERVCKNNNSHKDTMTLPVLTDTTVWTKGEYQAPTCEADGYQKYTSDYGEVTETIPATDHNWGTWTITKQPTQTETGTAERVCKNDSSHKEQKELPVLTDTTVWEKGEYKAPTCNADGYQKYTSGYGEVTETIPATDHSWGAWEITKQPTQTETGTAERVCKNDSSHKEQKDLPVLTDTATWTKGEYQAPTCEADGYQKYTSDYGEVTETIPATDHSWGAWTITKQPTQTETGMAERVCQNDGSHKDTETLPVLTDTATWTKGEYKAPTCDTDGYQKYTSQYGEVTETIPATDHNWGTWTITKQPTQTETGTAERVCQNDSSHKDTVTLPVLTDASVWTAGERVEPTCTADGSQAYTSDYGTVTEPLPATDHTFEWVIDRPATTEAPGIKHEECTKCHEKRNENTEIPQLPAESYAVHYDANGGSGTMPDGAAPKGKEFTLPENAFTPPEGKQFKCWAIGSIDGAQIQPGAGFTFMENTTVYAVWENIGFTITFDKNGGSSVSAETMVTNPDGKLSELPTAERSGRYRFKGWYTAKSGGTEVTKETVFTEDTTVYAQWTYTGGGSSGGGGGGGISVTRYTVTFDTQGGSEVESVRVTRNSTVTKPADPVREGYTFEGWFTDQECSAAYDFDTKVTKNITLYAKWTEEQPEEPTDPTKPESPDDWENPFDDVDEGDWFYDDVKTAYENGWFTGVTNTSFAPNEAITRGMMVTVLYRAENEPTTADKSKFEDVAPDAYYTKAVIWAENNGIVKGYSEVEFAPDKLISREEMAAIMHRYAGYKGADTGVSGDLMKFADQAQIADWARENVAWAVGYGLLSGKDNNLLDPQGHTTRAETAAILNRFLKK